MSIVDISSGNRRHAANSPSQPVSLKAALEEIVGFKKATLELDETQHWRNLFGWHSGRKHYGAHLETSGSYIANLLVRDEIVVSGPNPVNPAMRMYDGPGRYGGLLSVARAVRGDRIQISMVADVPIYDLFFWKELTRHSYMVTAEKS